MVTEGVQTTDNSRLSVIGQNRPRRSKGKRVRIINIRLYYYKPAGIAQKLFGGVYCQPTAGSSPSHGFLDNEIFELNMLFLFLDRK